MALARCILGKFLGVGCHCFPPPLDVPTFSARCLQVQGRERPLAAEGGTFRGLEMLRQISSRIRHPRNSRSFTCRKSATWDRPTASAGFEPANLGTEGQHATSRPPKLLFEGISILIISNEQTFSGTIFFGTTSNRNLRRTYQ